MNQTIAKIGSITFVSTVALFALFMLVSDFGSCAVCIFLALRLSGTIRKKLRFSLYKNRGQAKTK